MNAYRLIELFNYICEKDATDGQISLISFTVTAVAAQVVVAGGTGGTLTHSALTCFVSPPASHV